MDIFVLAQGHITGAGAVQEGPQVEPTVSRSRGHTVQLDRQVFRLRVASRSPSHSTRCGPNSGVSNGTLLRDSLGPRPAARSALHGGASAVESPADNSAESPHFPFHRNGRSCPTAAAPVDERGIEPRGTHPVNPVNPLASHHRSPMPARLQGTQHANPSVRLGDMYNIERRTRYGLVAESADAADLKSAGPQGP